MIQQPHSAEIPPVMCTTPLPAKSSMPELAMVLMLPLLLGRKAPSQPSLDHTQWAMMG